MGPTMHTLLDLLFANGPGVNGPVLYATIVVIVIGSIMLHELGHALVATWERDPTPRMLGHITWNPVVHMGWLSIIAVLVMGIGWGRTPVNPRYFRHRRYGSVLVSFAGPAVNLTLACFAATVLGIIQRAQDVPLLVGQFWLVALHYNVLLFVFNLIPLPPLDGFSVADGLIDLGALGAMLRQAGQFTFIIAILIVNSDVFDHVLSRVTEALARVFGAEIHLG
jgi:Zn-dependent protease